MSVFPSFIELGNASFWYGCTQFINDACILGICGETRTASFTRIPACRKEILYPTSMANVTARLPNVLFIAIDDLNDWVGCLGGHPKVKTPHIDRLADRGVLFTNAYYAAPLCNSSRAAIFSGRQPFQTGVLANDQANIRNMHPDLVLMPQHFKAAGYRTYATGRLLQ